MRKLASVSSRVSCKEEIGKDERAEEARARRAKTSNFSLRSLSISKSDD